MLSQCSAQGQEFKKVLVLRDAKADDWNIFFLFVYICFYMFIYICTYFHVYICICTALKINNPSTLIEIAYCKELKKESDSKIWMIREKTCRLFSMNLTYPSDKCKELPYGKHKEINSISIIHKSWHTRF